MAHSCRDHVAGRAIAPARGRVAHELADVDTLGVGGRASAFERGHVDQQVDDPIEALARFHDRADECALLRGRKLTPLKQTREAERRREWCPELVRDVRKELLFHALERALLAKVAQEEDVTDDAALGAHRRGCDPDRQPTLERAGGSGRIILARSHPRFE